VASQTLVSLTGGTRAREESHRREESWPAAVAQGMGSPAAVMSGRGWGSPSWQPPVTREMRGWRGLASMAVVEHLPPPARFVAPPLPKINRLGEWIPHVPLHPSRSPIENEFASNRQICGRLCHRPAMDACAWEAAMKLVAPALRRRMRPGALPQRWEGGAHLGQ
jgi:hypothetical protein